MLRKGTNIHGAVAAAVALADAVAVVSTALQSLAKQSKALVIDDVPR